MSERWRDASNEMISLEVTSGNPKKTKNGKEENFADGDDRSAAKFFFYVNVKL